MFDAHLRPAKQTLLAPTADRLGSAHPQAVTVVGVVFGLAAAGAAALSAWWLAVVLFLIGRLMDGLDGELARGRGTASDAGGYADIVADTVVYAAIPLGAAIGSSIDHIWPVTAVLLASFYLNTITWSYLSAVIEKRGAADRSTRDEADPGQGPAGHDRTSVVMPPGLVEGVETIAFFLVMLAVPAWLDWTMGVMAVAVTLGAVVRFVGGRRQLGAVFAGDRGATATPAARQQRTPS